MSHTNAGKPHICGTIQAYMGPLKGFYFCGICYGPVDGPMSDKEKKEERYECPNCKCGYVKETPCGAIMCRNLKNVPLARLVSSQNDWETEFDKLCCESFAKGGFLITDLTMDAMKWIIDPSLIKSFISKVSQESYERGKRTQKYYFKEREEIKLAERTRIIGLIETIKKEEYEFQCEKCGKIKVKKV